MLPPDRPGRGGELVCGSVGQPGLLFNLRKRGPVYHSAEEESGKRGGPERMSNLKVNKVKIQGSQRLFLFFFFFFKANFIDWPCLGWEVEDTRRMEGKRKWGRLV